MKINKWLLLTLLAAVFVLSLTAQNKFPKIDQRVSDFTNTLSFQEWQSLEGILKSFEDSTSNQVVVLIVNSLEGNDIEDYANKTFELNKIGQSKKDNGVLLLIAKQDRKIRIEVGYGLEGVLTDALTSKIIRQEIIPRLQEGNYFAGILSGVDAIMRATTGEYKANGKGKETPTIASFLVILAIAFTFFILMPILASRRRSILASSGHKYYSGWGYGGWPGSFGGKGGSFGGFGGFSGGGGMSGGGGASGSW